MTSTLNYQLESGAPESAVARIDYQYGDQTVGHAYLKASVLQGYVPETGTISGNSSGNPAENSSGDPSSGLSNDGETAAGSADGAEDEEVFNGSGSIKLVYVKYADSSQLYKISYEFRTSSH